MIKDEMEIWKIRKQLEGIKDNYDEEYEEQDEENKSLETNNREKTVEIKVLFGDLNSPVGEQIYLEGDTIQRRYLINPLCQNTIEADMVCDIYERYLSANSVLQNVERWKPNKKTTTPDELHKHGIIKSGNYSDWKYYIPNSFLAEAINLPKREIKLPDIEQLFDYVETALMLIIKAVKYCENDKIDDDAENVNVDYIWEIADSVLLWYEEGKSRVEMQRIDKNYVCEILFRKPLPEIAKERTIPVWLMERVYNTTVGGEKQKVIKRRQFTGDEAINYIDSIKVKLQSFEEEFNKKIISSETFIRKREKEQSEKLQFSCWLIPIFKSLCELRESNPFVPTKKDEKNKVTNIWKNIMTENKFKRLNLKGVDADRQEQISYSYRLAELCADYVNELEMVWNSYQYANYEKMCCKMIRDAYQIKDKYTNNDLLMNYYEIEKITGMVFVMEVADKINELLNNRDIKAVEWPRNFQRLLRKVFISFGTLTRIEVGVKLIEMWFKMEKSFNYDERDKILRQWVDKSEDSYRKRIQIYTEDFASECPVTIGMDYGISASENKCPKARNTFKGKRPKAIEIFEETLEPYKTIQVALSNKLVLGEHKVITERVADEAMMGQKTYDMSIIRKINDIRKKVAGAAVVGNYCTEISYD